MAQKSPYHRSDGSLKLGAQFMECFGRNANDLGGIFKGSGGGLGQTANENRQAWRDMWSR